MVGFVVALVMGLIALSLCYVITVRLYWSGRFAVYRLVDFVRSRKSD